MTPEPVIAATLPIALEVEDLRQVPLSEREQVVRQMAAGKSAPTLRPGSWSTVARDFVQA